MSRRRSEAAADGGAPARRAVVRWAWRLFRREWRQQALVLGLLTVAVAAAIGFASAAYNTAPVSGNAEYGTADGSFTVDNVDADTLAGQLAAARRWFGPIDVIGTRSVAIPGDADGVEYRAQDPDGPYGDPMLDLRDGRYPAAADEVAVTDGLADRVDVGLGATFAVDGDERTVVGVIEDPSDLDDEFALLAPSALDSSESVTVLVGGSLAHIESFRPPGATTLDVGLRSEASEGVVAATGVLAIAALALFLVSLVAVASFVVLAQRRLRQLGMLAAVGATQKHLRLVMMAGGTVTGVVAAVLGAAIGLAGWIAAAPRLEDAVGFRIDASQVQWWLVATGMVLAVLAATGAAWWPARTMARVPTVLALSGRPPQPAPARRSTAVAGALVAAGVACLTLAGDMAEETTWTDVLLVSAGTVATALGVLLLGPVAVRALARVAAPLPVAVRLALRDLGRNQARSAAALAAVSLVLGVPVALVVTASSAEHTAGEGNLSDRQLLVRGADVDGPFVPDAGDVADLQAGVDRLAATLDDPTVDTLEVAADPTWRPVGASDPRPAISLGEPVEDGWRDVSLLYVATPELLDRYGVDLDAVDEDEDVLTVETGSELAIVGELSPRPERRSPAVVTDAVALPAGYTSVPGSFVTPASVERHGWEAVPSGRWLVEADDALSEDDLDAVRAVAAGAGLSVEARDAQEGLATLRTSATLVGMVLALGVLAMTVGLIRGESAGDLRTLTATGATSTTRRTVTAATAGGLAVLGAGLGTVGAYAVLVAGYRGVLGGLTPPPVVDLAGIVVGTPLLAAAAGWLLAGRAPTSVARQPIQ